MERGGAKAKRGGAGAGADWGGARTGRGVAAAEQH